MLCKLTVTASTNNECAVKLKGKYLTNEHKLRDLFIFHFVKHMTTGVIIQRPR